MAAKPITTVAAYLAAQPVAVRTVLQRVRAAIVKTVPGVVESIKYRIPAFSLPGGTVLYLGAWKQHYALYPIYASITGALAEELVGVDVENCTIRFSYTVAPPVRLIARIARLRATEVRAKPRKRKR